MSSTPGSERATPARKGGSLHIWLKLVVCGVLFALYTRQFYVPRNLAKLFDPPFAILRDRTGGRQLALLFEFMRLHRAKADVLVAILGDSTVNSAGPEDTELPILLQKELAHVMPDRHVEVVDLGILGLYASDALFVAAEALSFHPDLLVYAISPRIVPTQTEARWTTDVSDLALRWGIVSRVGLGTVLEMLDPRSLGRTMAHSWYLPLAVRLPMAMVFWERVFAHLPAGLAPLRERISPGWPPAAPGVAGPSTGYQYSREAYPIDDSNRSVRALDALIRMCGAEGRCLLYYVPVNPASAETGFAPGLVDDFAAHVAVTTQTASVPYRDYRALGTPDRFRRNLHGNPDAIHLTADAKPWFASILARDVAARLRELGR